MFPILFPVIPTNLPTDYHNETRAILVKCRSIKNKAESLYKYIQDNDINLAIITESWLSSDDSPTTSMVSPPFDYLNFPRNSHGGRIGIVHNSSFKLISTHIFSFDCYELVRCSLKSPNSSLLNILLFIDPHRPTYLTFSVLVSSMYHRV